MADLGSDFSGIVDLNPNLSPVEGRLCLGQAIARRWLTQRGTLWYDLDYGGSLMSYINGTSDGIELLATQLSQEAQKDERVERCDVVVNVAGSTLTVKATVHDAEGPFRLVLDATQLKVDLFIGESA